MVEILRARATDTPDCGMKGVVCEVQFDYVRKLRDASQTTMWAKGPLGPFFRSFLKDEDADPLGLGAPEAGRSKMWPTVKSHFPLRNLG